MPLCPLIVNMHPLLPPYLSLNHDDNSFSPPDISNDHNLNGLTPIHLKSNLLSSNIDLISPKDERSPYGYVMDPVPNIPIDRKSYLIPEDSTFQIGIDMNYNHGNRKECLECSEDKNNSIQNFDSSQASLPSSPLIDLSLSNDSFRNDNKSIYNSHFRFSGDSLMSTQQIPLMPMSPPFQIRSSPAYVKGTGMLTSPINSISSLSGPKIPISSPSFFHSVSTPYGKPKLCSPIMSKNVSSPSPKSSVINLELENLSNSKVLNRLQAGPKLYTEHINGVNNHNDKNNPVFYNHPMVFIPSTTANTYPYPSKFNNSFNYNTNQDISIENENEDKVFVYPDYDNHSKNDLNPYNQVSREDEFNESFDKYGSATPSVLSTTYHLNNLNETKSVAKRKYDNFSSPSNSYLEIKPPLTSKKEIYDKSKHIPVAKEATTDTEENGSTVYFKTDTSIMTKGHNPNYVSIIERMKTEAPLNILVNTDVVSQYTPSCAANDYLNAKRWRVRNSNSSRAKLLTNNKGIFMYIDGNELVIRILIGHQSSSLLEKPYVKTISSTKNDTKDDLNCRNLEDTEVDSLTELDLDVTQKYKFTDETAKNSCATNTPSKIVSLDTENAMKVMDINLRPEDDDRTITTLMKGAYFGKDRYSYYDSVKWLKTCSIKDIKWTDIPILFTEYHKLKTEFDALMEEQGEGDFSDVAIFEDLNPYKKSNIDDDNEKSTDSYKHNISTVSLYDITHENAKEMLEEFQQMTAIKNRKYLCPICGKTLSSLVSVLRHVRSHSLIAPFQCLHIDCKHYETKNMELWKDEPVNETESNQLEKDEPESDMKIYEPENDTNIALKSKEVFESKIVDDTDKDKGIIEESEKSNGVFFPTFNLLYLHTIQSHLSPGDNIKTPFCCHMCPHKFGTNWQLAHHLQNHVSVAVKDEEQNDLQGNENIGPKKRRKLADKVFPCKFPLCGKRFEFENEFIEHQKTHLGVRPFICDDKDCKASFITKEGLRAHVKTHKKPYICTIMIPKIDDSDDVTKCSKTDKSTKQRKVRCSQRFGYMADMKKHALRVHGISNHLFDAKYRDGIKKQRLTKIQKTKDKLDKEIHHKTNLSIAKEEINDPPNKVAKSGKGKKTSNISKEVIDKSSQTIKSQEETNIEPLSQSNETDTDFESSEDEEGEEGELEISSATKILHTSFSDVQHL